MKNTQTSLQRKTKSLQECAPFFRHNFIVTYCSYWILSKRAYPRKKSEKVAPNRKQTRGKYYKRVQITI
jgi:hypothetical protein